MYIRNDSELKIVITKALQNAMENIMQDILSLLHTEIEEIVYEGWQPSFYDRTHEFMSAWKKDIQSLTIGAEGTIEFDPSKLSFNSSNFQHGNIYGESSAENLAHIIFDGAIGDAFNFPQIGRRDAWGILEKLLGKSKSSEIGLIFKRAMAEEGFVVK